MRDFNGMISKLNDAIRTAEMHLSLLDSGQRHRDLFAEIRKMKAQRAELEELRDEFDRVEQWANDSMARSSALIDNR